MKLWAFRSAFSFCRFVGMGSLCEVGGASLVWDYRAPLICAWSGMTAQILGAPGQAR